MKIWEGSCIIFKSNFKNFYGMNWYILWENNECKTRCSGWNWVCLSSFFLQLGGFSSCSFFEITILLLQKELQQNFVFGCSNLNKSSNIAKKDLKYQLPNNCTWLSFTLYPQSHFWMCFFLRVNPTIFNSKICWIGLI